MQMELAKPSFARLACSLLQCICLCNASVLCYLCTFELPAGLPASTRTRLTGDAAAIRLLFSKGWGRGGQSSGAAVSWCLELMIRVKDTHTNKTEPAHLSVSLAFSSRCNNLHTRGAVVVNVSCRVVEQGCWSSVDTVFGEQAFVWTSWWALDGYSPLFESMCVCFPAKVQQHGYDQSASACVRSVHVFVCDCMCLSQCFSLCT